MLKGKKIKRGVATFLYANADEYRWPCSVKLSDKKLLLYFDKEKTIYEGTEQEPGHYLFNSGNFRASLHWGFTGTGVAYGKWIEDGFTGFWELVLED